ncbi:glycine--tRNA ligase subunit beta [Desulfofustis limnaeus]|uniref:Glycine--tRNA ligase beta subunit n=1 Tax=Desulfofustis limnaeus TaxID=2740163 RepID=A0ABN6M209_9BACT|nr:glycine--tRNA ligase subunit beta [Desulfofustis limnaeus]BDD86932.1 glycine--tRNA ligase beta subunit [Desulfofustis limnaeus]
MKDLLFEIGCEELPAGFLAPAMAQLADLFRTKADKLQVSYTSLRTFSTPRRLALIVTGLADKQDDISEELLGPSKQAAYDGAGNPTKAAEGFARSKGVTVADLRVVATPKGEYLQLVRQIPGVATIELLPQLLRELLVELSFAKSMKWGSNQHPFARPIQWLLAIYGNQPVALEHEGIHSAAITRGHRFLAPEPVPVAAAAEYEETLLGRFVIVDSERRRRAVQQEITAAVAAAGMAAGATVTIDETLLDTVTNLVEYPFGVCGRFAEKFLHLPDEVLITSMREHQKSFPVVDGSGALLPGFVAVNNTRVKQPEVTRAGHERVLRARLEDAFFFFQSDRKIRLADRLEALSGIIFQAKLGTMREKVDRVVKLTRLLADRLAPALVDEACRGALLCKADLTTDMVGEFPTLQGVMGSAYAAHDGESAVVCQAIREHYLPLRAGSELPEGVVGALVGLADRIDTIAGCFGIGQIPTGTTDPFGLRRLALAIIHLVAQRGAPLSLADMFRKALALYGDRVDGSGATVEQVLQFIKGRFINDCTGKGMDGRAVDAACSVAFDDINDCLKRIEALTEIKRQASFEVLAGAFKRVRNIIKEHQESDIEVSLLVEPAERSLYEVYHQLAQSGEKQLAAADYRGFLEEMLVLKEPVDRFFDEVMVMVEDEAVKNNRLNLLAAINTLILNIGDISRMHSAG